MIIHNDLVQGSAAWLAIRAGIVTASEVDQLVTPKKLERAKGTAYFNRKLAEKWLGFPIQSFTGNAITDQGAILEKHAIPAIEFDLGIELARPGFITTDDGNAGCSPDGVEILEQNVVNPQGEGWEIKCPEPPQHIQNIRMGEEDYRLQIQMGLWVTGWKIWHFVSYHRDFPMVHIRVERDEKVIAAIADAVADFTVKLADGMAVLTKLNGGPRVKTYETEAQGDVVTRTLIR